MANMASACAYVVSNESTFNPVRTWTTKTAASTCIIVTVAVVSVCVMAVCGVFIVREYSLSASYKKAKCWVSNITYTENRPCTYCTQKQKTVSQCFPSQFPCVRITVAYENEGSIREGLLHSDSIEAAGLFSQCSHHACDGDLTANQLAIDKYVAKWKGLMLTHIHHNIHGSFNNQRHGKTHSDLSVKLDDYFTLSVPEATTNTLNETINNSVENNKDQKEKDNKNNFKITLKPTNTPTIPPAILEKIKSIIINRTYAHSSDMSNFRCFFNQHPPHDVIEHKTYTKWDAIHSMLWPSLIVIICCILFLYIETQRRQLTCCGRQPIRYVVKKEKYHHHHYRHHHHHYHHQYHHPEGEDKMALNNIKDTNKENNDGSKNETHAENREGYHADKLHSENSNSNNAMSSSHNNETVASNSIHVNMDIQDKTHE